MILKNFSFGKQPYNGPYYRRKKALIANIENDDYTMVMGLLWQNA
jgi:hypothetical protein